MKIKFAWIILIMLFIPIASAIINVGDELKNIRGVIVDSVSQVTSFLGLSDTPSSYGGAGGLCAKVNPAGSAIVFEDCGGGNGSFNYNETLVALLFVNDSADNLNDTYAQFWYNQTGSFGYNQTGLGNSSNITDSKFHYNQTRNFFEIIEDWITNTTAEGINASQLEAQNVTVANTLRLGTAHTIIGGTFTRSVGGFTFKGDAETTNLFRIIDDNSNALFRVDGTNGDVFIADKLSITNLAGTLNSFIFENGGDEGIINSINNLTIVVSSSNARFDLTIGSTEVLNATTTEINNKVNTIFLENRTMTSQGRNKTEYWNGTCFITDFGGGFRDSACFPI